MSAVTKHDAAQIAGRHRGIDAAPESPGIQQRQKPRVIDMRMCQKDIINQRWIHHMLKMVHGGIDMSNRFIELFQ